MADTNGPETFGDGSNRWIPGTIETLRGEGKNDLAGVADAAALNFDEGIGGLSSLVDDQAGNTAGPGSTPFIEAPRDGQDSNPGTTGVAWLDSLYKVALLIAAGYGIYLVAEIVGPLLGIAENLSE